MGGGVCSAAFTAYAIQGVPVPQWGQRLLDEILPTTVNYVLGCEQRHISENRAAFTEGVFENKWRWYLKERGLEDGSTIPCYPQVYGAAERDAFYAECAKSPQNNPSGKNP